jgi:hypothetical protein
MNIFAPQDLSSSSSGWNYHRFTCIKMKMFSITVFKIRAQRVESLKITFCHGGFKNILRKGRFPGAFPGWLQGGGGVSSSEADEPESNKFSARVEARVMPLPPTVVEDVFLPAILTPAREVFLARLSLEDCATNLLLCFKGLARASSCVEV